MLGGSHWGEADPRISSSPEAADAESSPSDAVATPVPVPVPAGCLLRSGLFAGLAVLIAGLAPFSARFLFSSTHEEVSSDRMLLAVTQPCRQSNQNLYGWMPHLPAWTRETIMAYQ